jgi:transcription elongation factor GreA
VASGNNTGSDGKIEIGCWVKIKEEGMDEAETFQIGKVTRLQDNLIAQDNPLGQALLGAATGDVVTVDGPSGPIKLTVLGVGHE